MRAFFYKAYCCFALVSRMKASYNQDGSLNSDDNKRISFEWNYLKKPKKITKANGQWQKFMYDASGVLLQTLTSTGKKIDHFGNLTFENDVLGTGIK